MEWKRVKLNLGNLIKYAEMEQKEEDRLPIVDYWIAELFRYRSYLQGQRHG